MFRIDNISLSLVVFIFSSTQYFYYFGIVRLGIASSIIAVAYRYIISNDRKKFVLMILIATMFHYSALFALIALFINKNKNNRFKKGTLLKLLIIIPLAFFSIRIFIYPLLSSGRYQNYIDSSGTFSLGFLTSSLPFFILFLFTYNKMSFYSTHYQFYFFLFLVKLFTEMFAPIIGIGRMVWYVNLSLCFLLAGTIRITKSILLKYIILLFIILYCFMYSQRAYFGDSFRANFMLPYQNILFDSNILN